MAMWGWCSQHLNQNADSLQTQIFLVVQRKKFDFRGKFLRFWSWDFFWGFGVLTCQGFRTPKNFLRFAANCGRSARFLFRFRQILPKSHFLWRLLGFHHGLGFLDLGTWGFGRFDFCRYQNPKNLRAVARILIFMHKFCRKSLIYAGFWVFVQNTRFWDPNHWQCGVLGDLTSVCLRTSKVVGFGQDSFDLWSDCIYNPTFAWGILGFVIWYVLIIWKSGIRCFCNLGLWGFGFIWVLTHKNPQNFGVWDSRFFKVWLWNLGLGGIW